MHLTWSTNKENMKTKELSKEVRHEVVEKDHSGEGYKKISKSLIIPLSMMKSIIKKWKMYHGTQTLPRSGRPSKLSSQASRKLVLDVTINPTMTLKDLQGSMSEMAFVFIDLQYPVPFTKLASMARKKQLLKKKHLKAHMEFVKKHLNDTAGMWRNVLESARQKLNILA